MDEVNQTPPVDNAQSYSFKAETKQLLNILIHSLYKDKEVFLRELLSNASDALNRLRFEILTNQVILDADAELCIRISADKEARTITIRDTGIGMNREEMIENLGTIAQSGARKFLEAAGDQKADFSQVIGQFGVGFYSVFMVAASVKVTSHSYRPEDQAVSWYATGEDNFQISPAEKTDRGTVIEITLKEDAAEFADEFRLKEIIRKHSDYIGFPIYLGDETAQINKQTAIWRTSKQDVTDEQYKDFYRQLTLDFEEPLLHIHSITDAPVQFYALLYVPGKSERAVFSLRKDDGLKLYSRNILIDEYSKDLLPEHLRFIQGVVDSEDLPLNVSRETFQATGMLARLKKALTGQVTKELENLAKNDAEKYQVFWKEFGGFLKQGVATSQPDAEKIYPLLRFKTNLHPDDWSSLEDYVSRFQPEQKDIYFIIGDDPKSVQRSPHLDYFQAQGIEVILLTEPIDSFMLMGLHKYKEFELKNVAQSDEKPDEKTDEKQDEKEKINSADFDGLVQRFKLVLGERVADVRSSSRLSQSVARLVEPEGSLNPEMQRVYKYLGKDFEIPKKILELNPTHPILKSLLALDAGSDLQKMVIEQILDSALLVEGLHPDPSSMVERMQDIIQAALKNN
jgi:molecular chaperone HtpG